jgi:predicted small metal-binding protein
VNPTEPSHITRGEIDMVKVINCDCGFVIRASTEDELVSAAQQHAQEVHDMQLTREQVLSLAVPAEE